uniref:RLF zinc finger n=1 Tax=Sphenodon punctatus TaxID=8508 RepID=A0A8D0L434_SPHPU
CRPRAMWSAAVAMADAEAEPAVGPDMPRLVAALHARLWQLQAELSEQEVSEASSRAYCRGFCQTLLQYAGNRGASEHILPFLEIYRVAIQSFANARPYLTTECEDVLLVLGRLVLSCFELLLSVPESEQLGEAWLRFQQSIQDSHDALLEFGNNNLQILVDNTREGVWKNPTVLKVLSQQPVEAEEVNKLITREGPAFLQMRIKHLMKSNCIPQATSFSKLCAECSEASNVSSFRQVYIACLCSMLPNEESIKEIAKLDCKEVLDIICNLEAEGQESTAFILCTTYLTQQLQTASVYCSWELTLFWSKLQRRIDPSLDSFLERCRQFGIIARTLQHLFFLIRVIQTEAEEVGLAVSVLLCVRALQIKANENDDMKTSVCKTIACLLPEDLEVRRACQLTEFLLEPNVNGYNLLEELYLQPDQKFDEENAPVPNSLRCELLLALKAYWPFDPEFWDWKTLKRHCLKLLGKEASDSEEDLSCNEMSLNETDLLESLLSDCEESKEENNCEGHDIINQPKEKTRIKKPIGSSERYQRWLQYKFFCVLCKRECIEARILHHSKMHMEDGVFTCPVCTKKFKRKECFVPHVMEHVKMPSSRKDRPKKKIILKKDHKKTISQKTNTSRFPSTTLEEKQSPLLPSPCEKNKSDVHDYVTFSKFENCRLQDRDLYPCPGTDCSRVFKQFKYLSVHLKAEHQNNDENAKHYLDMKNKREKCGFCRRHFMTSFHLREHERVHCGPQPFMCVSMGCYATFGSVNELLNHKQQHEDLRYKCELNGCNIVFSDLAQLYHHEAQHFRDASYTCNFLGCKKFYYSETEYKNHLALHNIAEVNAETKETSVKHEEPVLKGKPSCPPDSELLEQTKHSSLSENPSLSTPSTNSEEAPLIKKEILSDEDEDDEDQVSSLNKTVDHNQTIPGILLSRERVVFPSGLKEQCSNVAVCFDGKRFTCGFEDCGSTYKNAKGMQKHLRRAHPYHFKPKKKMGIREREILHLLNDHQNSNPAEGMTSELAHNSDTNADSLESPDCNSTSKRSGFKEEHGPCSPEMSFYANSKVPSTEDAMLELMLGLKHLSLNSSINSSRFLQSPMSKYPDSEDETTSEHFKEKKDKLPYQYLTQLAAKPFFCERQGCKYEFVTREALLMHYVRKHNYSKEMVLQLNMFQHRYSPFKCHICQRSFTRKTHLRIHYRNKHQIGKKGATKKLFADEKCEYMGTPAEGMEENDAVSVPDFFANKEEESDDQTKHTAKQLCHPKKGDCSSETDVDSSEEIESNGTGKHIKMPSLDGHRKEMESREGRGSKRSVAKGNLCYILHKYHKPFHCIHKSCNSAFTNQKGLIRHYRTVHQYNKEQLCLEKDKARSKRELSKCKKIFVCKYKECGRRFLCSKALAKHRTDFHNLYHLEDQKVLSETESARFPCHHPHCPATFYTFHKLKLHLLEEHSNEEELNKDFEIHCDLSGCDRIFTTYNRYSQHVYFRHSDYYDSLFGSPPKEQDNHLKDKNEQSYLKDRYDKHEKDRYDKHEKEKRLDGKTRKKDKNKEKHLYNFKTKEEALKMCRDNCDQTQYPCMVQGCVSVVKLESSIVRHYKRTHQMTSIYIEHLYEKLVFFVECGSELKELCLKTDSYLNKEEARDFTQENVVHANDRHASEEHPVPNACYDHQETGKENRNSCQESNVAYDTGAFLYSGTLKYNHSPESSCFDECSVMEPPLCKTEELPESGGRENSSFFTNLQLQLPVEKSIEDCQCTSAHQKVKKHSHLPTKDKFQKHSVPKPFDLKSFKPMGFESSFLKFIQESDDLQKDKDFRRGVELNNFVSENDPEASIQQSNSGSAVHEQVTEIQPLSTESPSVPSLENLRAILDKALTDCGDLALKQLHYLRPVVVLERSKFSTPLIDLFPTKKTDQLCVGSS